MYASMLKWKKGDQAKNGAVHWTLRRSLGRKAANSKKVSNVDAKPEEPKKSAPQRKSIRQSILSIVGKSTESKGEEDPEIVVNRLREGSEKAKVLEVIHTESGARIKIAMHGGNLMSYRASDGKEKLFVSQESKVAKGKALRGGVPVVFPQFGNGPLPAHGFARTATWELCDGDYAPCVREGMVHVAIRLRSNKDTLKIWGHKFELLHMIRFGPSELETSMNITNMDKSAFQFNAVLHTYLRVRDISKVTVEGLGGLRLIDKLQYVDPTEGRQVFIEQAAVAKVNCEVDSIYMNVGKDEPVVVTSPEDNSRVEINMALCRGEEMLDCDAVMWNPWKAKGSRLSDFGQDEYKSMICIEPGCASRLETCNPSETWTITQNLKFSRISRYGVR